MNTDAEGRMAMVDALCEAKEMAVNEKNPFLFTVATLTGHVSRCYGTAYTAIMSNGPACEKQVSELFRATGSKIADPYEISTIRREDYDSIKAKMDYAELLQCSSPSDPGYRGHQFAAAFLITGSGLDNVNKKIILLAKLI